MNGNFSNHKLFYQINIFVISTIILIVVLSLFLQPEEGGYRTHESLGLPSCLTARIFNIDKCPSCGLTTSFALISKGRFQEARKIHPWGLPAFSMMIILLFTALLSLITKNIWPWLITGSLLFLFIVSFLIYWSYFIFFLS